MLKGTSCRRVDDEVALAFVANGLSTDHSDYLAAGGYGFIIGDGRLNYSPEMIAELYYKLNASQKKFWLSQIINLFYTRPIMQIGGAVNVLGIRAHVEF